MNDILDSDDAATPLTPDEKQGLIPTHIALRHELNEAEQRGVLAAEQWAFGRKRKTVLDEGFLQTLHRRMFQDVWRWAGKYRTTPRNIGVEPWRISVDVKTLLDDTRYWIDHRLVWVHPFPNGNGRHARLAADLLITTLGGGRFTWGRKSLVAPSETRKRYVAALRAADNHDIAPLLDFARS
jgi:Fic-DOC domain mobile mystery protein B